MEYGCKGKHVCITGGTSGIGLAVARTFIRDGARVLVVGRNALKGAEVVRELAALARQAAAPAAGFFPLDVSSRACCQELATAVQEFFGSGGLDILVTSAGVYQEQPLAQIDLTDYADLMNTNVAGTLWVIQAVAPFLNEGSSIVTVGSDAGVSGNYGCPLYCASKGAVVAMSKALALDLAPRTRVNCVCPGDVATPLVKRQLAQAGGSYTEADMAAAYPLGRIGKPEEIAHMICAVASPANNFMTGAVIMADGGLTAK
ncbi:MAG: SDR family oxidoreductase [Acidaminococcaceae bacterium]|jgi:NAD(P)-dependent dehydrogenase (short-subunit alcohol dehydrogenase family)|nr:SDR family oxidoreductase [Acidaminococcaceae bacterium]